ncbi:MAG: hypothetical protein M0C28_30045 [Candidatus Moduliflexus flocculans]|nr:hypothetical protein [Candidatus Moduliflexus flocculans]
MLNTGRPSLSIPLLHDEAAERSRWTAFAHGGLHPGASRRTRGSSRLWDGQRVLAGDPRGAACWRPAQVRVRDEVRDPGRALHALPLSRVAPG